MFASVCLCLCVSVYGGQLGLSLADNLYQKAKKKYGRPMDLEMFVEILDCLAADAYPAALFPDMTPFEALTSLLQMAERGSGGGAVGGGGGSRDPSPLARRCAVPPPQRGSGVGEVARGQIVRSLSPGPEGAKACSGSNHKNSNNSSKMGNNSSKMCNDIKGRMGNNIKNDIQSRISSVVEEASPALCTYAARDLRTRGVFSAR